MNPIVNFLLVELLLVCSTAACSNFRTTTTHGIPNLVQVAPDLWRSGQPATPEQWAYIRSLGITRVAKLNFDTEGSDAAAGIEVVPFSIQPAGDRDLFDAVGNTLLMPSPGKVDQAERMLEAPGVKLVHCTRGRDRTGLVLGLYRVRHDHWSKDQAYREMLSRGFTPELRGLSEFWEDHVTEQGAIQ